MQAPDGSPLKWFAHGPYSAKGVEAPVAVFEVGLGWTVVVLQDKGDAEKPVQRLINVVTRVRVPVVALGAIVLSVV